VKARVLWARKIYISIAFIAKNVGLSDKRDYLVEIFLPIIVKIFKNTFILEDPRSPVHNFYRYAKVT
jgi:hypothetical protein